MSEGYVATTQKLSEVKLPIDPSRYDRTGELSVGESEALTAAITAMETGSRSKLSSSWKNLHRLMTPLDEVAEIFDADRHCRGLVRSKLICEMHERHTAYWAWSAEVWLRLLKEAGAVKTSGAYAPSRYRNLMMAVAYLLCGYDDLQAAGTFRAFDFASRILGRDRLQEVCERVRNELRSWGCGEALIEHDVPNIIARAMLANRSSRPEDLTTEKLREVHARHVAPSSRNNLVKITHALFALGIISAPLSTPSSPETGASDESPEVSGDDDCPEEWARWCRRWYETSTLAESTRNLALTRLKQAGRWLARNHPEVTFPGQWTRELAAEYVAAIDRLKCGELSASNNGRVRNLGRPMAASTKSDMIGTMSTFFTDCQEWGWIPRRLTPNRAFATPKSIKACINADPRVIEDPVWAKLMWAGLNLSGEDVPNGWWAKGGKKSSSQHPFEMVRAIAIVWLFSGLRNNEIRRLRVGCVRWQRDDVEVYGTNDTLPKDAVCWLDIPTGKTSRDHTKPVDPMIGEAIGAWEAVRPRQSSQVDEKTAETVHYLFSHGGKRFGENYINAHLIPLLCRKAGVPEGDARGNYTSHRARSTISTQLLNAKEPMSLFELKDWLGHQDLSATQHYAKVTPTRLAKSYSDAGYFGRNLRMIEVLIDGEAVRSGAAVEGEPWKFYDLGHGYCTYDFFQECPHRMACAGCSFYVPKGSSKEQILEGKANLSRMREEIPLTDEEVVTVDEGIELHDKLLERLADTPTPAGPTPRELGRDVPNGNSAAELQTEEQSGSPLIPAESLLRKPPKENGKDG